MFITIEKAMRGLARRDVIAAMTRQKAIVFEETLEGIEGAVSALLEYAWEKYRSEAESYAREWNRLEMKEMHRAD